ncbi:MULTISPECIES: lipase family protein [unclassified Streptomyces]|uniref:lipase family protein n=1 Tax=unclassified Streptomyces TaxID=2593676 RepID=UPI00278C7880|nr:MULTISPECIES: lipase family protein [unclassified Streptomyces]
MRHTIVHGPAFADLRPLKEPTFVEQGRTTFPVHPELPRLLSEDKEHPDPAGVLPHTMATLAAYAYAGHEQGGDAETVAMMATRLGLERNRVRVFEQRVDALYIASAAYLIQDEERRTAILCYRGTQPEDIISILTDADVRPETLAVDLGDGEYEVHAGFYRNMRATRYLILQALERAVRGESIDPDEKGTRGDGLEALYITGHSLGAAMAALMAVTLVHEPRYAHIARRLRAVYTFGQPMLGGPDLARACESTVDSNDTYFLRDRLLRYIYDRDVVPALPPRPVGPYAPFGREFHFRRPRGAVDSAFTMAADAAAELAALPGDLLTGANPLRRARRMTAIPGRAREEGWVERVDPALPYPQMDSLAGLAVVAPLAFFAARLALTRTLPFKYSFDDHGPAHYVNALAPPGVLSEYGDVR